jgi:hypothetical protein
MNLCGLLSIVEQTSGFRELETKLLSSEAKDVSVAVPDAARSFLIGALHERLDFPILVITAQPEGAKRVYEELQVWRASSARLYYFP